MPSVTYIQESRLIAERMDNLNEDALRQIEAMIDRKIAEHERRVGWVSGIIGVAFIAGIIHSIWLVKQLVVYP